MLWPVAPILLEVACKSLVILLSISTSGMALCCHSVVFATTPQLHSPEVLTQDSAEFQIVLVICQRFVMVRISDNGLDWK